MKKISLLLTALFVLTAATAFAQTADVAVTANVEGSLSVTQQSDVLFGTVQAGETHTINTTTNSANLGSVVISGQTDTQVFINTEASTLLTGPGDDITANLSYFGNTTNDGATAGALNASETLSGTGDYYVFVGAEIVLPNTQVNGAYSGTTTIEVSYSTF